LQENPEIVVATPGRLIDFIDEGVIDLSGETNMLGLELGLSITI
jgi:superfamily II DNA/RNA helicase